MEETIELREIIEIILKGKWIISIITICCVLLAGILSWLVLPEKYESKAVVQVTSGSQDAGIMESFVATEFTPQVYTHRLTNDSIINSAFDKENLQNEFSKGNLTTKTEGNLVTLKYVSDSPENAQKELQTILATTRNEMNDSVQRTLNNLEATYNKDSEALSDEIESIINDYNAIIRANELPEILILQTFLNSEIVVNITEEQIRALANVTGELQNQLLQLQAQIQIKSSEYRKVLAKYQSVKTGLENFKPDPFIRIIAEPSLPKSPSSPNNLLNLAIAFVLGVMLGLGVVFFRHYWKESAPMK